MQPPIIRAAAAIAVYLMVFSSAAQQILATDGDSQGTCRDREGLEYNIGETFYRQSFHANGGEAESLAADIVLLVDESGSLDMKIAWIREVVLELDYKLKSFGVGAGSRLNHFSLVGFGRSSLTGVTGILLSPLVPPTEFFPALSLLQSSGSAEDGYAAIEFAVREVEPRSDTVKLMILVTDEDRRVIREDLDKESIGRILNESGYLLNVVVNQGFLADSSDTSSHAMGLDSNRTAYYFNPSSPTLYSSSPNGGVNFSPFTFFPNTFADYVDLALGVGGAAWDLNFVVEGQPLSLALARALAEVNVAGVMATVSRVCESCVCEEDDSAECQRADEVDLQNCTGLAPDTRCFLAGGQVLSLGESGLVETVAPENQTLAADIILLVDESSSMITEHDWISQMITLLDSALQEVNVGVVEPNRFGLVGFGGDCSDGLGLGRVIATPSGAQFSFSTNFTQLSEGLTTSGRREDGYSAIQAALETYPTRQTGTARQFILVTDEDRDVVDGNLTRESIAAALVDESVVLNVAVNEEFSAGDGLRALGIDSSQRGYVFDPSSQDHYRVLGGGETVRDSGHGQTHRDYTQLALATGGGAWDLNILRLGSSVGEAFTAAFVKSKVEEIVSQLSRCLNCSCTPSGPVCTPTTELCSATEPDPSEEEQSPSLDPALSVTIDPSSPSEGPLIVETLSDVSLTCSSNNSTATVAWTFNGGQVPFNSAIEVSDHPGVTTLQLTRVTKEENHGVYACLARVDVEGEPSSLAAATLTLEIYNPAQDLGLNLSPLEVSRFVGQSFILSCSSAKPVNFSWTFDDGPLPPNVGVVSGESGPASSVLALTKVMEENVGGYTCRATSNEGLMNEDTAYLTISSTP